MVELKYPDAFPTKYCQPPISPLDNPSKQDVGCSTRWGCVCFVLLLIKNLRPKNVAVEKYWLSLPESGWDEVPDGSSSSAFPVLDPPLGFYV